MCLEDEDNEDVREADLLEDGSSIKGKVLDEVPDVSLR